MTFNLSRRDLVLGACAASPVAPFAARAEAALAVHVVKGTGCACCTAWAEYLQAEGFDVTEEELYGTLLIRHKLDHGVPQKMMSCHTGHAGGYVLEGHVPTPAASLRSGLTPWVWQFPACPTVHRAWVRRISARPMTSF